jgi:acetyl-CoA carboxylase biotin carboxylase subunit
MYMGIETVAIYSEADKNSLHVQLADEAVCVGGPRSDESYLNMENIITAAINKGAEAIHPGFGFLSENARFVELCETVGITFIGPNSKAIESMGNKSKARALMLKSGVPCVPGSEGAVSDLNDAKQIAEKIGFPILIKASAGGGGKGMRVAYNMDEFVNAFETAKTEAKKAFGDETMYLEKYLMNPKHIEFQVLSDQFGHVIHLGERDCSIQRHHQKVIEEAPSLINEDIRRKMGEDAIKACRAVQYENAGTVEFLLSGDDYYFIEMNTRIQVEHPVTEMITGIDIIREQILIASGEKLTYSQDDIHLNGHSIECRINAEDPKHKFRPSPGRIDLLHIPQGPGIRFDSFIYSGIEIPPYYDSMVGKLIVHGRDREEATKKMQAALEELVIKGIQTNQSFLYMLINQRSYLTGDFNTSYIEKHIESLLEYEDE